MGCSNCFNGCADIVSDQCVKYTGLDVPGLGISNGDPLLVVENQIINKILTLITGEGIIPIIDPTDLCHIVSSFLPVSGDITINHVVSALIQSICELEVRLTDTEEALNVIEADYVLSCLTGVSVSDGTHAILQATITKLCQVDTDVETLTAELEANYVLISDINDYIAAYIDDQPTSTLYSDKMIPYTAVPYFGPTAGFFDVTGAGIGDWLKIYLCNGQNLTPDLRGRVIVGTTTMGNTAFSPVVDPALPGNPTYSQDTEAGTNSAVLTSSQQLPPHSHPTSVDITDPGHTHSYSGRVVNTKSQEGSNGNFGVEFGSFYTSVSPTGLMGNFNDAANFNVKVVVGPTGASQGHNNIQPVHASNYIIYIP
jgi:microcystin-dependent protein